MRSYQECEAAITKALGKSFENLTAAERDSVLEELTSNLQSRERYLRLQNVADPALRAADELARDLEQAAIIEKRNAALNQIKRIERTEWVQRNFGRNVAEGLEAMLVGVNRAKQGARESVSSMQVTLRNTYLAGMTADIERTGNMRLLASGTMDRDIGRALWAIGRDDEASVHAGLPAEAVELAKVLNKWQEVSRLDANDAGASIGKEVGYITRQSHDSLKIRGKGTDADMKAWAEVALRTFDLDRMMAQSGASDPAAVLRSLWTNLASGNHMKAVPEDVASGFKGPGNLAKKLSQERTIHFKDADAWADYNAQFGTGNLRESIFASLDHSASATGLMRVMGTNPQAMLDAVKADLMKSLKDGGDIAQAAKLNELNTDGKVSSGLGKFMAVVDGSANIPGNQLWARRSANLRSWQMLAKLGGMVLSQLNDVAVYGSGASYQGRGFLSGMAEAVAGLGRSLKPQETRDLAASLGVTLDNMAAEISRVGTFSEGGTMAKATQLFMKLNLASWWTSRMRVSAAFGTSHFLALQSGKTFDALGSETQRLLSLYNVTPERWEAMRSASATHTDGKAYLIPENIQDRETADALRTLLTDQTGYLALEPDAKTRAYLLQGTRPGTWTGETARHLMLFKSFTGAYMQKIAGRELLGKGYEGDSLLKALVAGNGEFQGLAQIVVMSTLLGYGSMSLKDLAKGRTPRDPTKSGADGAKVLLAALLQGGGAGIYGDFLFGQASRMGSGTLETIAGPTISSAGRIIDLYHKGMAGDDVAARAVNEALNNTPFANLFYLRQALNYALLYRMQESMNSGFLRRMERQVEKENAQTFLVRPSEVVR